MKKNYDSALESYVNEVKQSALLLTFSKDAVNKLNEIFSNLKIHLDSYNLDNILIDLDSIECSSNYLKNSQNELLFEECKRKLIIILSNITAHKKVDNKINNSIFIVHGHNIELRNQVELFLHRSGIDCVILDEESNKGKTIFEKFEIHSDVSNAIILYTADDLCIDKTNNKNIFRPRQNVIFEYGFFCGKLGRENIISMVEKNKNIQLPSDIENVGKIEIDKSDPNWERKLRKELKELGFKIVN